MAYATGERPDTTVGREWLTINGQANEYAVFRFQRARDADGFRAVPELSVDLSTWSSDALVYHNTVWNQNGTATVTWRSKDSCSALGTRFFIRLKVRAEGS